MPGEDPQTVSGAGTPITGHTQGTPACSSVPPLGQLSRPPQDPQGHQLPGQTMSESPTVRHWYSHINRSDLHGIGGLQGPSEAGAESSNNAEHSSDVHLYEPFADAENPLEKFQRGNTPTHSAVNSNDVVSPELHQDVHFEVEDGIWVHDDGGASAGNEFNEIGDLQQRLPSDYDYQQHE